MWKAGLEYKTETEELQRVVELIVCRSDRSAIPRISTENGIHDCTLFPMVALKLSLHFYFMYS
jgi:hypothetical protein